MEFTAGMSPDEMNDAFQDFLPICTASASARGRCR